MTVPEPGPEPAAESAPFPTPDPAPPATGEQAPPAARASDPSVAGEFRGSHALVTGAAQGVGRAVAELLAARGASVLAVDISPEVASLEQPASGGAPVRARQLDLADAPALHRFAAEVRTATEVDLLVNCAAAYPPGDLLATDDADWQRVLQVNVLAAATLARAVAQRLVRQGRPGAIVNVGSVQQVLPLPGHSAYVTSKGALSALTSALAVELGRYRIRVNEVTLGLVDSAALRTKLGTGPGDDFWGPDGPPTLLGRAGTPAEAAEAIAFLGSGRASYITGASLAVDGGRRLSRRHDRQFDSPGSPAPEPGATAGSPDHPTDREPPA